MAYSLVAGDEVAYMVDLHLFLGRPLRNEMGEGEGPWTPEAVCYGVCRRRGWKEEEWVRGVIQAERRCSGRWRVAERAMGMYHKTREGASAASAERAKQLRGWKMHPMWEGKVGGGGEGWGAEERRR